MQADNNRQNKQTIAKASPHSDPGLYVLVLENIDRAVIALGQSGRVTLFNPAAESFMERSARNSIGEDYQNLFCGQETFLYLIKQALEQGRSITDDEGIFLVRAKSPPLPVNVYVAPIFSKRGNQDGAVLIIRDLSRVKELEETLRRVDRLSMLGTLAAGLAHEIKNPLGGIKGAAQLLEMELSNEPSLSDYTQVMIREAERINGIIEELMDLASPRPVEFTDVNLARILGDIVLLQKEASRGKNIKFILDLDPSIPPIQGDENLLTRLFLNLVKNARESIQRDGEVRLKTKISSEYHLTSPGSRPSPMVLVKISDNGCGIPAEEVERVFTPYFTTKAKGTGLGLAISQKVVEDHRGFLKIVSTEHEGTEITISLPLRQ
ncbi:MAG: PAS domain-containing protein [Deltaproteobacteria bacterium]|jgi:two-component system nitrogen regulation sensor histidine kinase GlnL|nr:PAS domain-containing protein [Deltaproteobacteria bacterium]MBW2477618.1 PAS domain-containing protein [Deltaproteobacteria bacterium]MBW2504820.1 PAS domain-containing protein [Deltaproteobacteria bacterium]MBW2519590.1 PAS domain-containing protein [Deltaproteobacteria bacterium]